MLGQTESGFNWLKGHSSLTAGLTQVERSQQCPQMCQPHLTRDREKPLWVTWFDGQPEPLPTFFS